MTLQETRIALVTDPPPRAVGPGRTPRSARDAAVDVARAVCLVVVITLHAMMVGVGGTAAAPIFENAMEQWPGFAPLTWAVQVMPLFFVLGGFAAFTQWARLRERGGTAAGYVSSRLRRLLPPAAGAIAATAILLLCLRAAGVPGDVVGEAGFRMGQPLWFLGVYLLCTGLVPLMAAAHRRRPFVTLAVLGAAALAVDIARATSGLEAIGYANLLFVWLLAQQLGFLLADGTMDRIRTAAVVRVGVGALAAALALCAVGLAPFDLFAGLNPPSVVLGVLGLAQLCAFTLLRPWLRGVARGGAMGRAVAAINGRAMTIYSWHMLALIGLAGILLLSGATLPDPLTAEWWGSRPLWLGAVAVGVIAVVRVAGRLEDVPGGRLIGSRPVTTAAALLAAAAAVLLILIAGREPLVWVAGGAVMGLALASRARR